MIYLDNGATSLHKPQCVSEAVKQALDTCANPGRGGHRPAMEAARTVLRCRETAAEMFDCEPEQVVFTSNCTHGLNIAISSLVKPGDRVAVSGFEHNAVIRPLHRIAGEIIVCGRKLFDWDDTLEQFEKTLKKGVDAAIFTHVSNAFGYILPVEEMAMLCGQYGVPFAIDAAQSAGVLPVKLRTLGADYIAMPGHKGLLGPQGTGILLCNAMPHPLIAGGTGSLSHQLQMPDFLPDRAEAGTLNVPGIAGLNAGMRYLNRIGIERVFRREQQEADRCIRGLKKMGYQVFSGEHQSGTVSFVPDMDCEQVANMLGQRGVAVRAGLHCAPIAHKSAGTLESGTVRVSFGHDSAPEQTNCFLQTLFHLGKSEKNFM